MTLFDKVVERLARQPEPNKPTTKKKTPGSRKQHEQRMLAARKIKQLSDRALGFANEASDIVLMLSSLRNKPGPLAWIAAGTKISNLMYKNLLRSKINAPEWTDQLDAYTTKLGGKWTALETNKVRIVKILNKNGLGEVVEEEEEDKSDTKSVGYVAGSGTYVTYKSIIMHAVIEGCDVVWKQQGQYDKEKDNDPWVSQLRIRTEEQGKVLRAIGNLIWKSYGTNHLATSSIVRKEYSRDSTLEFTEDLFADDILPSQIGDQIADRTRKFLDVPEITTRAILLYGPPGTGKSTAARYIAQRLAFRSLRVSFQLLKDTQTLIESLDILRPDMIIIDDIDRTRDNDYLLECLELLRKRTKLIIASANYPDKLDYAVLRPGRFDEAINIVVLDEAVIKRTVGEDLDKEVYDQLKTLPIAYINEFHLRQKVLGPEVAAEAIKELYALVEMGKNPEKAKKIITIGTLSNAG